MKQKYLEKRQIQLKFLPFLSTFIKIVVVFESGEFNSDQSQVRTDSSLNKLLSSHSIFSVNARHRFGIF